MKQFANDTIVILKAVRSISSFNLTIGMLICVTFATALFSPLTVKAYGQGAAVDLCKVISGEEVAKAIGGRIMETKSLSGRCVYIVGFGQKNKANRAFVIYKHEASDYDGLKDAMEGKIMPLEGVGDEAVGSFDSQSNRYWLLFVKRGKVACQVSGDSEDLVRKVAVAALKQLVPNAK